jgi:hypothetical protein
VFFTKDAQQLGYIDVTTTGTPPEYGITMDRADAFLVLGK